MVRSLRFRKLEGVALQEADPRAGGAVAPLRPAGAGQASFRVPRRRRQRCGPARGAEGSLSCRTRQHVCALCRPGPQMLLFVSEASPFSSVAALSLARGVPRVFHRGVSWRCITQRPGFVLALGTLARIGLPRTKIHFYSLGACRGHCNRNAFYRGESRAFVRHGISQVRNQKWSGADAMARASFVACPPAPGSTFFQRTRKPAPVSGPQARSFELPQSRGTTQSDSTRPRGLVHPCPQVTKAPSSNLRRAFAWRSTPLAGW